MGATWPGGGPSAAKGWLPSMSFQPRLAPRPPPKLAGSHVISSISSWPTSATHRSSVSRSKVNRHGLRTPNSHTSGAPSTPSANGLDDGTA